MVTRRACLVGGATAIVAAQAGLPSEAAQTEFDPRTPLPHKDAFDAIYGTYLNCASQHPLSLGGRQAINRYLDYKSFSGPTEFSNGQIYRRVLERYARLINAHADEVCFVQSTTVGENLVLKGMQFPQRGGRIVTDDLHYVGSLPTYAELRKSGVDIETLRADALGRVSIDQFERAIDANTQLVCISSVSMVNGFQQDLPRLCEIAHAKAALVYADIVHEVGSMPFDVKMAGVDFCSAASYKWLMGEQGLGFLYARKERLGEIVRPWFGHYQLQQRSSFGFPDLQADGPVTQYKHYDSALGFFAMGSQANINAALLDHSLAYLITVDPQRIQLYRQPMVDRLQEALPALGYAALTPSGSESALVSFRHKGNSAELREKLADANITITVAENYLRVSPSVFNDMDDIERLIDVLG